MILVASTIPRYVTDRKETSEAWLYNAEAMKESHPDVRFFASFELDAPGIGGFDPFRSLCQRLRDIDGNWYRFSYTDYRHEVSSGNRLNHIVMGRNIIQDRAMDIGASHILFLDADMCPPADAIPRLLELDWPVTGGHVPTYCLDGPAVPDYPSEWDVREHMNTAGFLLVARSIFSKIRWRWSLDDGMTDDPSYWSDVSEYLGTPTYVRHSVVGTHYPESILPIEQRFQGRNLVVDS